MKTIILCGGRGTRLKDETEYKPKPMVYVGDKPILWHIMKLYACYGFNEFILALGYKADYVKDYFLNQKAFTSDFTLETINHKTRFFLENRTEVDNFKITFVDTGLETMPGERIMKCQKYLPLKDKYFMVTYGDGVADIDLHALVRFHKKHKKIGTITGIHPRFKYGVVKLRKDGVVEEFKEKPILSDWANGGFMIFDRRFFNYLEKGQTEHPALYKISKEKQLALFKHEGFWQCIDTNKELEELNDVWKSGNAPWKVWK